ncbi:MAG: saccharopine dehydrogenase C-terminal domain-containing protein [Anaerolineae bacterium]
MAACQDHEEQITSMLIALGVAGGYTAMAHTVGSLAVAGARMILKGEVDLVGVHIPVATEVYEPALEQLERLGIVLEEQTIRSDV